MSKLELRLLITTCALIFSWLLFLGFGIYTWGKLNAIGKYSVTYACETAEWDSNLPIEVRYKCSKLKEKNEKTSS
jgi:hypothetical protein